MGEWLPVFAEIHNLDVAAAFCLVSHDKM